MKVFRPHLLAAFLQLAPLTRVLQSTPGLVSSPAIAILRWVLGSAAVAGSMHGLSGASGISPTAIRATNGIRSSTTFIVNDSSHGTAQSYSTASALPPGMTLTTRGILSGTPTNGGNYTLAIRGWEQANLSGNSALKNVSVTVVNTRAPVITAPPTNITVNSGQNATFSVQFTGDRPLTIRWLLEDVEVRNATNATLVLSNVQPATAGRYRVRLVNSVSTVFSDFVTLTVNSPLPPPGILAQPASTAVHVGETARFGVQASGTGLSYAWTHNGQAFPGTNSGITLTNVTGADVGTYGVRISNAAGSTNSAVANLVVLPRLQMDPPTRVGEGFELRFAGVDGRLYRIESAPDLLSPFSPVQEVLGKPAGTLFTVVPTNGPTRVYRVKSVN